MVFSLLSHIVEDIDFSTNQIVVREGTGEKGRLTMLPAIVRAPLMSHLERVCTLYQQDLERGFGRVYLPDALRPLHPPRCPGPHPSAHLGGSPLPPSSTHECSSQENPAVLKFPMGWRRGSVPQRFCGGSAPQKRFFVRCPRKRICYTPMGSYSRR